MNNAKRVLIVNCFFDETRGPARRTTKQPLPMGPAYLAGAFDRTRCEVRLYNEVYSGPLEDPALFEWPDMLVLTGLTNNLDRMRHLTAYVRTANPHVVVVAGGPAIRALPELTRSMFDYACSGDVEQMRDVIAEEFGREYVTAEMIPRFDLAYWVRFMGHVESTRNCNFACSFCSIAGEGGVYQKYNLDYVRRQIKEMERKPLVLFIDQNFYGNDRKQFLARLDLIQEMRKAGHFRGWSALVTNDFFLRQDNLDAARESGCVGLFSGVESFDTEWLLGVNKKQNTHAGPSQMIRNCLESGLVFLYGLMLDPYSRPLADLRREMDHVTGNPEITLPGFLTLPIPLPGTAYFDQCASEERFLPNVRLRDLDGWVLTMHTHDPLPEAAAFARDLPSMRGYHARIVKHAAGFTRRYWRKLSPLQIAVEMNNSALLAAWEFANSPHRLMAGNRRFPRQRTFIASTEVLDDVYQPRFPVASKYLHYFEPIMVTDSRGQLSDHMAELSAKQLV